MQKIILLLAFIWFANAQAFIQIDANVATDQGSASLNHVVSPPFDTTSSNELILAFISAGYKAGQNTTVKNVSGGGLTWSLVRRANGQRGTAEIWQAVSPTVISDARVRANLSQKVPASITVLSFSGVRFSAPVGASAVASAASGAPSVSLTTTQPESFVVGVGIDPAGAAPRSIPSEQLLIHQYLSPSATFWVQSLASLVQNAQTSVTINATAPTNRPYNLAAVEIIGELQTNPTSTISGNIQDTNGNVLAGVTVTLSGPNGNKTTTTDGAGNYFFNEMTDGSYEIIPSMNNMTFNPTSKTVTVNGADVGSVDFTGGQNPPSTYSLSGNISTSSGPLAGVTVTLSGSASNSATTDASGNFMFSGLNDGNYVVSPTLSGYTFSPVSRSVTVNGANVGSVDFTAGLIPPATYTITGNISTSSGPLAGVTVVLSGSSSGSATTDVSGNFRFSSLANGSYVITPSLTNYTFSPASRSVVVNSADVGSVSFSATANPPPTYTLSGSISTASGPLAGVTVTLSGAASLVVTTNSSGGYSFPGLVNGSYVVTPALSGYTFSPVNASVSISSANRSGVNFSATPVVTSHQVTLAWDAPTTYQDGTPIAETVYYKIHYGNASQTYTTHLNVQSVTQYTVTNLPSGTYYFAVSAYIASGAESPYSSEVSTGQLTQLRAKEGSEVRMAKELKKVMGEVKVQVL